MTDRDAERVVDRQSNRGADTAIALELNHQPTFRRHATGDVPSCRVGDDGRRAILVERTQRAGVDIAVPPRD